MRRTHRRTDQIGAGHRRLDRLLIAHIDTVYPRHHKGVRRPGRQRILDDHAVLAPLVQRTHNLRHRIHKKHLITGPAKNRPGQRAPDIPRTKMNIQRHHFILLVLALSLYLNAV